MREILFRGRRICNGEWVYGLLTTMWGQYHIIGLNDETTAYPVEQITIGQYIGLEDRNGVKIYEGDIIRGQGSKAKLDNFVIRWVAPCCGFTAGEGKRMWPNLDEGTVKGYEVVGNIHDNPELMREEADND